MAPPSYGAIAGRGPPAMGAQRSRALALAMLGLACVAVVLVVAGAGPGRTALVASKHGGGADSIFAETGVAPDAPKRPVAHHSHHPGLTPNAMTAAEYEAKLGRDVHGHPLPKPAGKAGAKGAAVRQATAATAATDGALPAGWQKKFDKSKGKSFYINPTIKAVSWKRPTASAAGGDAAEGAEGELPAGWVKKFDTSKGKSFYINPEIKAVSWKRPTASAAPARDSSHFKHPQARNPTYEGTGKELNEALSYNKREVAAAKDYYAHVAAQREQMQAHRIKGQQPQQKKSRLVQQLGDRSFFKFDPVKGSFYRYSPDVGAVAKPGSIADTLNKVAASATTPTITVSPNGPALPSGDIVAARRPAGKAHAKSKARFSQKKSVDLEHTAAYKEAQAKANAELMNVARTVAMNAGYVPGGSKHAAAAPKAKAAGKGGASNTAAKQGDGAKKADAKSGAAGNGKAKGSKGAAAQSKVPDPDWEARKEMNQVWKGQRSFYKYDPAKGDFYKYTPDASRHKPGVVFAPEDRI